MKHLAGTSFDTLSSSLIHFVCAFSSNCFINILFYFSVAICCCLADSGYVVLDPNKLEEKVN